MNFDYTELTNAIYRTCGTQKAFAEAMNMTQAKLSSRLNNRTAWTQDEIKRAVQVLAIEPAAITAHFFKRSA